MDLQFGEEHVERENNLGFAAGQYAQTHVQVEIRPKNSRSRRRGDMSERARLILQSIKAYLMAKEVGEDSNQEPIAIGGVE